MCTSFSHFIEIAILSYSIFMWLYTGNGIICCLSQTQRFWAYIPPEFDIGPTKTEIRSSTDVRPVRNSKVNLRFRHLRISGQSEYSKVDLRYGHLQVSNQIGTEKSESEIQTSTDIRPIRILKSEFEILTSTSIESGRSCLHLNFQVLSNPTASSEVIE